MNNINETGAGGLLQDPRIRQAKQLIKEAIEEHQSKISGIRPPNPDLATNYDKLIEDFTNLRAGKLWFPYIGSGLGKGSLVELLDGSVKYDFITGIGVHFFGHNHPLLLEAGIDAAISSTVMQGNLQQSFDSAIISDLLVKASGLDHCFLTTSGVMANENGLKLAFQKKFPARRVLAFESCFLGRTLAASQITDNPAYRSGIPINYQIDYIPFYDSNRPEESIKDSVKALKKVLRRYPKDHVAMIFELVQGEGGFNLGTREFYVELMTLLKDNNITVFVDEVQTFGRLYSLFAFQHFRLESFVDIVTIGKLSQICATLFTKEFKPGPGLLSQTFTGSTSSIKAGIAIILELLHGNFYGLDGKIAKIYHHFEKKLTLIADRHPGLIQGPFGIGCMIAFTPFDGSEEKTKKVVHALFEAGVLSFIAGSNPMRVRFLIPAGAITDNDIDIVSEILEQTLLKISNGGKGS